MEDEQILELLWQRSDLALCELERKYGRLCRQLAQNTLHDPQDTEECVSDAFLAVWNAIPPARPQFMMAFVCRIVRNQALKRFRHERAQKRDKTAELPLDELVVGLNGRNLTEETVDAALLGQAINAYLHSVPQERRKIFVLRYWYHAPIEQIARSLGCSQSKVKSALFRMRVELRDRLEKEGFAL